MEWSTSFSQVNLHACFDANWNTTLKTFERREEEKEKDRKSKQKPDLKTHPFNEIYYLLWYIIEFIQTVLNINKNTFENNQTKSTYVLTVRDLVHHERSIRLGFWCHLYKLSAIALQSQPSKILSVFFASMHLVCMVLTEIRVNREPKKEKKEICMMFWRNFLCASFFFLVSIELYRQWKITAMLNLLIPVGLASE